MSLNISVIIWTVIDFGILMFLLDRLLFKPLLTHMHERDDRIKEGKRQLEDSKARKKEVEEQLTRESERVATEMVKRSEAINAEVEDQINTKMHEASAASDRRIADVREECAKMRSEYTQSLEESMPEFTAALANALTAGEE